jgi:hypothetical protein
MVILSAVKASDTAIDVDKKIRAISYFLDYLATVRVLNQKENTYDNIRDLMFEITKEVRELSLHDLKSALLKRLSAEKDQLDNLINASYDNLKRQDLLHLLARIADHLENALDFATKVGFSDYVDRTRDSRTFDVEHLLTSDVTKVNIDLKTTGGKEFTTPSEFQRKRDSIGGLILLPRGRNRSMRDMPYSEKLSRYSGENVLAQTLTETFFLNQPNWVSFSDESGITLKPSKYADSTVIDGRTAFYLAVAKQIWGQRQLEGMFA